MEHNHSHESLHELTALLKYLVKHNEAHTKEIEELASELKKNGEEEVYNLLMNSIQDFTKGNEALSLALKHLEK